MTVTAEKRRFELSSAALHILAMVLMLFDHIWGSFPGTGGWMTCVGRIAYPIFAFMLAEGFRRTHNLKKYALRLAVFALLAEVPFDLMYSGMPFDPSHQNVLWTFLIALCGMALFERAKKCGKVWKTVLLDLVILLVSSIVAIIVFTDYHAPGVLTVYVFYFLHKRNFKTCAAQALLLLFINNVMLKGYYFPVTVFGFEIELQRQVLAALALIPIWLYRGRQGYHSKPFKYFCYAFYPVHALILYLLATYC